MVPSEKDLFMRQGSVIAMDDESRRRCCVVSRGIFIVCATAALECSSLRLAFAAPPSKQPLPEELLLELLELLLELLEGRSAQSMRRF